jgi:hypothetical protein
VTWRPWIIVALGILAFMVNVALLKTERIPYVESVDETRGDYDKELRAIAYNPAARRQNFEKFGMEYEMAEATATHIGRFERQRERFGQMMEEQAVELGDAFCPSDGLPQPYAALAYLVAEENEVRRVVDWSTLRRFDLQPWYAQSLVPALYDRFERSEGHKKEATLMAVSAALLRKEGTALDGQSPWSTGLTGNFGFGRLVSREPRVKQLAIEYFGLMHFLTEIANGTDGICQ